MKKVLLIAAAALIFTTGYGQEKFLRFGPKVGVSSTNLNVKDNIEDIRMENGEAKLGFHVGAFARLSIGGFYIQPEALYTSAGGRVLLDSINSPNQVTKNYTLNKFDVPVMVGVKFVNFLRVQAGPVFSMILNHDAKQDLTGSFAEIGEDWKNATIGYQVGLGVDIGSLIVDFKYEGNLSKASDNINIGGNSFSSDFRNRQLILSVGLNLL